MDNLHFVSETHRRTFEILSAQARAGTDREYQSALYILAALEKDVQQYVKPGTIYFTKLIKAAKFWSSSEKALIKLAACLFNDTTWPVKIGDVFFHLDQNNTRVALEALRIRYLF